MNASSGPPIKRVALETASMRADFQTRLQALRDAAQAWGVQPNHPEGLFVSTMIGTQSGFAELALSLAESLHAIVQDARAGAEDELAKQKAVTERTRQTLVKASGVIENLDRGAQQAIEKIEVDKTRVLKQLVQDILPEMTRGLRDVLVIKQRRYNHNLEFLRALCLGVLMVGMMLTGYFWGTWSDWGMAGRVETIGAAIERCQLTSHWEDDKGNRLCEMKDFSGI
jgi:hypothetical protein